MESREFKFLTIRPMLVQKVAVITSCTFIIDRGILIQFRSLNSKLFFFFFSFLHKGVQPSSRFCCVIWNLNQISENKIFIEANEKFMRSLIRRLCRIGVIFIGTISLMFFFWKSKIGILNTRVMGKTCAVIRAAQKGGQYFIEIYYSYTHIYLSYGHI